MPEMTAQVWAMESIRHSSFCAEPSGVPSSKYARRYQSPSHAFSRPSFNLLRCRLYLSTRVFISCCSHKGMKEVSTVDKNQPSQTLSPLPATPTRFIPSFQSPEPIN